MKKFWRFFVYNWRLIGAALLGLGIVGFLVWFRLGTLAGGVSNEEFTFGQHIVRHDLSLQALARQPFYLPFMLLVYVFAHFHVPEPAVFLRSISGFTAVLSIISFFYILKEWHTIRIAILGSGLLATSSWFLHTARYGSPNSGYLLLIVIIACWTWLQSNPNSKLGLFFCTGLVATALYVPGLVWFLVPGLVLQRRALGKVLQNAPRWFLGALVAVVILLLTPGIMALAWPPATVNGFTVLLTFLGLPNHLPAVQTLGSNLLAIPRQIFFDSNADPTVTIGSVALLDYFTSAMVLLGLYSYAFRLKLDRTKVLLVIMLLGSVLIALNGASLRLALLLPFVYLIAVEGITLLLQKWLAVFPRNPFARSLGVALVAAAVTVTAFYHLANYFVAWPHVPATKQAFSGLLMTNSQVPTTK